MNKKELGMYQVYKKRAEKLKSDISDLRYKDIDTVSGKVKGSMRDFPYTERRFSVQMELQEEAERVHKQMAKREHELEELEERMRAIEEFIDGIGDVHTKSIFEYRYLDGMTQSEVGDKIGYTHGRISQIITSYLKKKLRTK